MARSRKQLELARDLLLQINAHISAKNPASFLPGENEDKELIPQLLTRIEEELANFNPAAPNQKFITALNAIFAARCERNANGPMCHTLNASHPINQVCVLLAAYLDPQKRNGALMPLVAKQDIYGFELDRFEFGEFIIADNKRQFILLEPLLENACKRMQNLERSLYVTVDQNNNIRPLSKTELQRCGKLVTVMDSIAGWYGRFHRNRLGAKHNPAEAITLLRLLRELRESLRGGDVAHGGEELNAGVAANEGMAIFFEYFNQLITLMTQEERLRLLALTDGDYSLEFVLNRLARPHGTNYEDTRYCIQTLGRLLDGIIDANHNVLSGLCVDEKQNLQILMSIVKAQLHGQELDANPAQPKRKPEQREISRINPKLTFNENEFVISFIAPKSSIFLPFSAKIIVEGVKDGRVFVGSYYIVAKIGTPGLLTMNAKGVITKVKAFESYGYAQIPQCDAEGHLAIADRGKVTLKFDQVEELRKSLSRSHVVPAQNAMDMIKSIKQDVATTAFAYWIYGRPNLVQQDVDDILGNEKLRSLFLQYEAWGRYALFGGGKNNYVTWCEDKLAVAGCSQHSVVDDAKAKPIMHVKWW